MTSQLSITHQAIDFISRTKLSDISKEALEIARRCIIDSCGLYLAGSHEKSVQILIEEARDAGGRRDASLLRGRGTKVPAALAARVLGTAGHAHDWDDTQVSDDPNHIYGLLTHPSIPPLTAALVTAEMLGIKDGAAVMLAFQVGFEFECKVSEWMLPRHYRRGHHSSGTVGTFGACAAASKLLNLSEHQLAHAIGIAASLAAGIRVNFGTMTKPLHVGRACENGVTAAVLAHRGFEADESALDGQWGFFSVMGEGFDNEKANAGFGAPLTITYPGVSIKPYPSGILTHQSMDAMLALVQEHDIQHDQIENVRFYAGKNITEPIRYPIAQNHLQAKFSMPALLAMIALCRRASHHEFTDKFVCSNEMQDLQRRIQVLNDPAIDALGYDKIRSRIELVTRDGRTLTKWADEQYRGGPSNPLSDADVEHKFRMCAEGVLSEKDQDEMHSILRNFDTAPNISRVFNLLCEAA